MNHDREPLQQSLFKSTSAFASQPSSDIAESAATEIPVGKPTFPHIERIVNLVEGAIIEIEENHPEEALDALEEIRDLLKDA